MIKSNRGEKRVKLDDLRPKILTTKISFECKIFNILVLLGRTEDIACISKSFELEKVPTRRLLEREAEMERVRFEYSYHRCVDRIRHQAFGICGKIDEKRTRRRADLCDGTKVWRFFETSHGVRNKIT